MTAAAMRDYLELAKPRITTLVVFTCASGLWLAPGRLPARTVLLTLVGTVLIVAAANVLNMYLERDSDALMKRTMHRPLPAGRMDPQLALRFGLALAAVSVPLLTFAVGPLPGLLASLALVRTMGYSMKTATVIAASLAQIGEFSFIFGELGVSMHLLPHEARGLIVSGAIFSILLNPFAFRIADWFERPARKAPEPSLAATN